MNRTDGFKDDSGEIDKGPSDGWRIKDAKQMSVQRLGKDQSGALSRRAPVINIVAGDVGISTCTPHASYPSLKRVLLVWFKGNVDYEILDGAVGYLASRGALDSLGIIYRGLPLPWLQEVGQELE